jgi:phosphoenolpyruvate-protein phosphotransferase (PTS system enzyme I)
MNRTTKTPVPETQEPPSGPMQAFSGLSINFGTVVAQVCLYSAERHKNIIETRLATDEEVQREITRFRNSLAECSAELETIAASTAQSIGKSEAEIFTTQKHIMNDAAIVERIEKTISTARTNAEFSIHQVFSQYEEQFAQIDNVYLRERASDIGEVRTRLLDHMRDTRPGFVCQGQSHCSRGAGRIIVSETLTPDMIVQMDLERVKGFVTEHGGVSSHAAVIARSLGVPAVSGVQNLLGAVRCGDRVLIDGDTGTVYLHPDETTIADLAPLSRVRTEDVQILVSPAGTEVLANASLIEDVKLARRFAADGIGLFRTEILFMKVGRLLSEEEQYRYYRQILDSMDGRPVIFRLLDVGGDKPLPFLRIEKEENPYLGWRGARFLLGSPDVMGMQVRALARASRHGSLKMMIPMVVDGRQARKLRSAVNEGIAATGVAVDSIKVGAMYEVPSAMFDAKAIFEWMDFGSIGSNDLIQYLFAIDRNNERVSGDYDPEHPVLWRMLVDLTATARGLGRPLSICGEIAGREGIAGKLLETGISSLSVSPRLVNRVRGELGRHRDSERK